MKKQDLTLILSLIVLGATNTLFLKFQNIQQFQQGENKKFFHPFIQTLCMFVGEILCGIMYLVTKKTKSQQQVYGYKKQPAPVSLLLFPAIMDLLASLLSYIALNMVASSVWQISRGGVIITTAIFSFFFLKKKFQRNAIIGCLIAFVGITGVQVITVVTADESTQSNQILGVLLLLASLVFNGGGLVAQKWIFNKYQLSPFKLVFFQGLYGFITMLVLSFVGQFIPCPWDDKSNCVVVDSQYYVESFGVFFEQIAQNMLVWIFVLCLIISISISVPIAVTISKRINPLSRSLADVCRTLIIWAVGIVITVTIGVNNKSYQLQETSVVVNVLKGLCFAILIFGTMLYHDMLPCFGKKMHQSLLLTDTSDESLLTQKQKLISSTNSTQKLR